MQEENLTCQRCGKQLEIHEKTPFGRQRFCTAKCRLIHWRIEKQRLPSGDRRYVNPR